MYKVFSNILYPHQLIIFVGDAGVTEFQVFSSTKAKVPFKISLISLSLGLKFVPKSCSSKRYTKVLFSAN